MATMKKSVVEWVRNAWFRVASGTAQLDLYWWPWRLANDMVGLGDHYGLVAYDPHAQLSYVPGSAGLSSKDYDRLARSNTGYSLASSTTPRVIGALGCYGDNVGNTAVNRPTLIGLTSVETTQIGPGHLHPVKTVTIATTLGANYVTQTGMDYAMVNQSGTSIMRIESGADIGLYRVQSYDYVNTRVYLANLDGTPFVGQATASGLTASVGVRMAFFNETSVIPNGVGLITVEGTFDPDWRRESYILRIRPEKSGNADAGYEKGTYWFSLRPFRMGLGDGSNTQGEGDNCWAWDQSMFFANSPTNTPDTGIFQEMLSGTASGGSPGMVLDVTNNRLWAVVSESTGGSIMYWPYKHPENFRQVATTAAGTPNAQIASINIQGAPPVAIGKGANDDVYVVNAGGAQASVIKIATDLTAQQVLLTALGLTTDANGMAVDATRNRSQTGGVSTGAGTDDITITGGNFTSADIGRVIQLSGLGADNGLYKISAVGGATAITVTTQAGGAVSFTGATGGNYAIGDRIYIFFGNATTLPAGSLVYVESLDLTTLHTVAMAGTPVNGRKVYAGNKVGGETPVCVDPINGNLYWVSDDTTDQVNQYDVSTQTWSRRLFTDFNGLNGGSGTMGDVTSVNSIAVNRSSYFRELWIATNEGFIKLDATNFAGSYERYNGYFTYSKNGFYQNNGGRLDTSNTNTARNLCFGVDGRVFGSLHNSTTGARHETVTFNREANTFALFDHQSAHGIVDVGDRAMTLFADDAGNIILFSPGSNNSGSSATILRIGSYEIHYQYIGATWVPKEVVRAGLPDATSSPGCSAKDIHTTSDALVMGVRVKFTPQGGATPHQNEYLGRAAALRNVSSDGATVAASNVFNGSGFSVNDVNRFLRIESGADAGTYRIITFNTANQVVLRKMNGTAFSASATAGTLDYTIWEMQSQDGPECYSCYLANGFGKDNTQQIDNIVYEFLMGRTMLYEQAEAIKVALTPLGPPGSAGMVVRTESYTKATANNYSPGIPNHLALAAGTTLTDGQRLINGQRTVRSTGLLGRPSVSTDADFSGIAANATVGHAVTVDMGADVEVGSIIVRGYAKQPQAYVMDMVSSTFGGMIAHLWKANASGGAPVASSAVRTSGANGLNQTAGSTLISLTSGNFLGSTTASAADGATTNATSVFTSAVGRFTGHEGKILNVTSGTEAGAYRIVSVNGDGSEATISNLDRTAKVWSGTASGLSFEIKDGVRDNDMIAVAGGATHKLSIDRLLSSTSAQIRVTPSATLSNQAWEARVPTWELVKRISPSVQATGADDANNGTFFAFSGREGYSNSPSQDWKAVADLSGLTTAQRTGRYWKFSIMPRRPTSTTTDTDTEITQFEFYDTAGKFIGILTDAQIDGREDNLASFMAARVSRVDWIQAKDDACSHLAGHNGLVDIGGTNGDTATLSGGAKFLGFQVRTGTTMWQPGGNNIINFTSSDAAFTVADVGRILKQGTNYYRISSVNSATQVAVTTPAGGSVTLPVAAGPLSYTIHEGINAGTSNMDYLADVTGGVSNDNREYSIKSISADLTTITFNEQYGVALTGRNWEIRRRCIPSTSTTTEAAKSGRLLLASNSGPRQSGDAVHDASGTFDFHTDDVGSTLTKTNGSTTAASNTFTGSDFSPDDVGRILVINSGSNVGAYRIDSYVSSTQVTVKNAYTGAAQTFAATAASQSYKIVGLRRLRYSRYAVVLRA